MLPSMGAAGRFSGRRLTADDWDRGRICCALPKSGPKRAGGSVRCAQRPECHQGQLLLALHRLWPDTAARLIEAWASPQRPETVDPFENMPGRRPAGKRLIVMVQTLITPDHWALEARDAGYGPLTDERGAVQRPAKQK